MIDDVSSNIDNADPPPLPWPMYATTAAFRTNASACALGLVVGREQPLVAADLRVQCIEIGARLVRLPDERLDLGALRRDLLLDLRDLRAIGVDRRRARRRGDETIRDECDGCDDRTQERGAARAAKERRDPGTGT